MKEAGIVMGAIALLATATGCSTVSPWQREYLAKPAMTGRLATFGDGNRLAPEDPIDAQYRAKVLESTTGGGLPGNAPGGGCGCTQ